MTREEQEQRKLANQLKRVNETTLLCTEFLLTNESDIELSQKTGISSSTVGRRLTNKENISLAYEDIKEKLVEKGQKEDEIPTTGSLLYDLISKRRQENLLRGKSLGGQTTLLNHVYSQTSDGKFDGSTKIKIDVLYKDIDNQYKFIVHAALTFRLHLDTLSQMLQIDENELLENMIRIVPNAYDAIKYLLYHDVNDQNIARGDFLNYYRELLNAIRMKDIDEKKRLISVVSDSKVAEIRKKHEPGDVLTDEEFEAIVTYQVKYGLTQELVTAMFDINIANYNLRIGRVLTNNPKLRQKYDYLSEYNKFKFKEARRYG